MMLQLGLHETFSLGCEGAEILSLIQTGEGEICVQGHTKSHHKRGDSTALEKHIYLHRQ